MKILNFILAIFAVFFIISDSNNYVSHYNINIGELCLIRKTTGFPCPACGMTRAHIEALKLNFKKAFYYHPLFIFPSIIFAIMVFRDKSKFAMYLYNNNYITVSLLLIFIIVYIVRFILLFPNKEPFTYNYNSNFYKLFEYIKIIYKN